MFHKFRSPEPGDITANIQLISATAAKLLGTNAPDTIRQIIGDCVLELSGARCITVSEFCPQTESVVVGYIGGFETIRKIAEKRGWLDYTKLSVPISSMTGKEYEDFTSGKLRKLDGGIFSLGGRTIPKFVSLAMERVIGISEVYTMGFSWSDSLFGGVSLLMGAPLDLNRVEEIEAAVTLGAVALQRSFAEKERITLEDRLLQAQKMEAVGRLAGGVAHDFNNLLTVISGYSELALSNQSDKNEVKESLEEISSAAEKASSLTQQLLTFSRKHVTQPEVFNLSEVASRLRSLVSRLVGEHIELVFPTVEDGFCIRSDRSQMEQVIINLIANARDAMPEGGKITLTLETAEVDMYEPLSSHLKPGKYVALSVIDSGKGIEADLLDYIFEPFFTTKDTGKGTGLGLATVYGIVQQSGGTIIPTSTIGVGTNISIFLPAVSCDEEAEVGITAAADPVQGSETILLVEDEEAVRKYIATVLDRQGYQVRVADSSEHAVELCLMKNNVIDLLITDLIMPGMNGRELAEKIHQMRPTARVLFVSGYTEDTILQHGVNTGSMAFLQKPFTASALITRVRSILDEGK